MFTQHQSEYKFSSDSLSNKEKKNENNKFISAMDFTGYGGIQNNNCGGITGKIIKDRLGIFSKRRDNISWKSRKELS